MTTVTARGSAPAGNSVARGASSHTPPRDGFGATRSRRGWRGVFRHRDAGDRGRPRPKHEQPRPVRHHEVGNRSRVVAEPKRRRGRRPVQMERALEAAGSAPGLHAREHHGRRVGRRSRGADLVQVGGGRRAEERDPAPPSATPSVPVQAPARPIAGPADCCTRTSEGAPRRVARARSARLRRPRPPRRRRCPRYSESRRRRGRRASPTPGRGDRPARHERDRRRRARRDGKPIEREASASVREGDLRRGASTAHLQVERAPRGRERARGVGNASQRIDRRLEVHGDDAGPGAGQDERGIIVGRDRIRAQVRVGHERDVAAPTTRGTKPRRSRIRWSGSCGGSGRRCRRNSGRRSLPRRRTADPRRREGRAASARRFPRRGSPDRASPLAATNPGSTESAAAKAGMRIVPTIRSSTPSPFASIMPMESVAEWRITRMPSAPQGRSQYPRAASEAACPGRPMRR